MKTSYRGARTFGVVVLTILVCLNCFATVKTAAAEETTLPDKYVIKDMPVYAQQHSLSCEYSATRAAVSRWGLNIGEQEFINGIGFDENPHLAFRGNINGWFGGTWDYGIYAEPIALYLATRGLNTKLLSHGMDELKAELAMGRPVVVWIPAGLSWGSPYSTDKDGLKFKLMPLEHAVTLYGYDQNGVYVADPGYGVYSYYGWSVFMRAWGHLDYMGMSVWSAELGTEAGESIGVSPYFYRHWLNEGGVSTFGYPITAQIDEDGKLVQYFERVRMEYDPNLPKNQPIRLGMLGKELTLDRLQETAFQPVLTPNVDNPGFYVAESKHTISAFFLDKWLKSGSWNTFGLPLSESFNEAGKLVQYFERARFEYQPESTQLTLGLLGREKQLQDALTQINLNDLVLNLKMW